MKNLSKVRGMGRMAKVGLVLGGLGVAGVMAAGPSFASTPVGGTTGTTSGHAVVGGAQNKGTSVTQYKTTYTDYFFGSVSVSGVHQVKNGAAQDSFTATSTNGGLTSVTPGQHLSLSDIGGWISDFDGQNYAKTFSASVSLDGMSYTAVVTY
jgi:hypothetical protein